MKNILESTLRPIVRMLGVDVVRYKKSTADGLAYPPDFSKRNIEICERVRPYTMTSPERVNALIEAVKYVVRNGISGAMVECGVWKGGSAMAMALTLAELGDKQREIFLYDTFSGMNAPTDLDVSLTGEKAKEIFSTTGTSKDSPEWCISPLEEVRTNVLATGYPGDKFHFVEGKVEDTIPKTLPKSIALLRLDTDWYESTKHELTHLFPLLSSNGVIIIDDYGHWEGARRAVDEYFMENNVRILLNRIDYTGRIGIKTL